MPPHTITKLILSACVAVALVGMVIAGVVRWVSDWLT